jgi:hypothetical protein
MKVPLDGGPPTVVASEQNAPRAIAVDATSVYWHVFSTTDSTWGADGLMKLTPK